MKQMPTVQKYMTTSPHVISSGETVVEAENIMSKMKIRHLPVLENGDFIGVLSDRDIKLAMSFTSLDPSKMIVRDIYTQKPYTVSPESKLNEVSSEMAEKHIGAAIVLDNETVVGIFTTMDVCRVLAEILQQRFHN